MPKNRSNRCLRQKKLFLKFFNFVKKIKIFFSDFSGRKSVFWIFTAFWNTPKPPSPPNLGFTRFRPLSYHWFSYRREPSGLFTRSLPPSLGLQNAVGENQRLSSFESRWEICNLNCNWWGSLIKPKRVSLHKQLAHYPACLTEFRLLTIRSKGSE